MTESFSAQVMLCWPTDREEIKKLNARLDREEMKFAPSIDHSLSSCDGCPRRIWIGAQQLELVNSAFVKARKLCLFCAGAAAKVLNLNPRTVDVTLGQPPPRSRTL